MTGIANYTFNILRSALDLNPRLQFIGFREFNWQALNATILEEIATAREKHTSSAPSDKPSLSRFKRAALSSAHDLSNIPSARSVYRHLKQLRFAATVPHQPLDFFHAFNFQPPTDPGIPILHVIHDLSTFRHPEFHPAERVRWLNRLASAVVSAPLVQTVSQFSKREIAEIFDYPIGKIFVAPPAAAPMFVPKGESATQCDLNELHLKYGDFFLAVGTMEPRKNVRSIIAAYAELPAAERQRYPMIIVGGKGWGNLDLPKQTENLIAEGSLRIIHGISDPQLRSLYEGARLLLMPSLYEGFGMPVVEALACGTPVAYTGNTAMDEISGDLGVRVSGLDVKGWCEVLKCTLDNKQHSDPSLRAARIAQAATFSWTTSARAVLDAYRNFSP